MIQMIYTRGFYLCSSWLQLFLKLHPLTKGFLGYKIWTRCLVIRDQSSCSWWAFELPVDKKNASELSPYIGLISRINVPPFYSNCWTMEIMKGDQGRLIRQKRQHIWSAERGTELNCIIRWVLGSIIIKAERDLRNHSCNSSWKARYVHAITQLALMPLGGELQGGGLPTSQGRFGSLLNIFNC